MHPSNALASLTYLDILCPLDSGLSTKALTTDFFPKTGLGRHQLRKDIQKLLIDEAGRCRGEKKRSRLLRQAERIARCQTGAIQKGCDHSHRKYTVTSCQIDFCPMCGGELNIKHMKRILNARERLSWAPTVGYYVFTLPKAVSDACPDKKVLTSLGKDFWRVVEEYFDTPGAVRFVHFTGDTAEGLHIHFNFLFPLLCERGEVSKEVFADVRAKQSDIINRTFGLNLSEAVSHYNFAPTPQQTAHKIRYVTRSTIDADTLISLPRKQQSWYLDLSGWRNLVYYGELRDCAWQKFREAHGIEGPEKYRDICPVDATLFRFEGNIGRKDIPMDQVRMTENGRYIDRAVYAFLKMQREIARKKAKEEMEGG